MSYSAPCRGDRDGGLQRKPVRHGTVVPMWRWIALVFLLPPAAAATSATQGDAVVNIATVRSQADPPTDSAPVTVRVRIPTPATLLLLEYAPRSPAAAPESVAQCAYQNGPAPTGTPQPLPPPR